MELITVNNLLLFKVVALGSTDEREMIINAFSGVALKPIFVVGELTLKQVAVVIKKVP